MTQLYPQPVLVVGVAHSAPLVPTTIDPHYQQFASLIRKAVLPNIACLSRQKCVRLYECVRIPNSAECRFHMCNCNIKTVRSLAGPVLHYTLHGSRPWAQLCSLRIVRAVKVLHELRKPRQANPVTACATQ